MRRLFWRIFAAFWLAAIAIILALTWITSWTFESERIPGLGITRLQAGMDDQLLRVSREMRRRGYADVSTWPPGLLDRGPVSVYLIDPDGEELFGHALPDDVANALKNLHGGTPPASDRIRTRLIPTREGGTYVAIARFDGSAFGRLLFRRPAAFWSHVGVALAIGALVSLLLAWYVAKPLERIRDSARRFAEGDLRARVGPLRIGRSAEMIALATEFDRMAERIATLVQNNQRLVRDVSHELRSPLARLRVALELARDRDVDTVRESLDRIEREADRLEAMLSQAIELSRLETTREPRREVFALDELLEDAITNATYEGLPRGCKVVFGAREAVNVDGSADALYSALENVIRNALAYTADATTVEVSLRRLHDEPRRARIEVRDHGCGVAAGELHRIFEPFYRTDVARARSSGGTGLGLAIARRAIENHGGTIRATNAEGGGLVVGIDLPIVG